MKSSLLLWLFLTQFLAFMFAQSNQVKTVTAIVEGINEKSGICSFKGIPFASPPVGDLGWKEPQPVKNWTGILKANQFGPAPDATADL